jgi:hypothetical protein
VQFEGVEYEVNWKKFIVGSSFFIPCLNCKRVRTQLKAALKRMKLKTVMRVCIEEGVRGLRVWRAKL